MSEDHNLKRSLKLIPILAAASLSLNSCSRPDTDVTSSPEYNFSSFAGTVWKTKVKIAIADLKLYTGTHVDGLLVPKHFDPKHPEYTPAHDAQIISVLPVGTHLRINKLMKDNGEWGGVQVTATLVDGAYPQKIVYLDDLMLAKNGYLWPGEGNPKIWAVNPEMLEK